MNQSLNQAEKGTPSGRGCSGGLGARVSGVRLALWRALAAHWRTLPARARGGIKTKVERLVLLEIRAT